ncbi:RING-H2 finger protein ATL74-like [Malania oleifera]|uniref:RING-H2 finger protein ATL74-like n=1 Tax=Malania oleifera TaxID=397392 RepID=UPI0025AE203E|nr:RING-H2 finger protein ATL74-like [Malania oleifera]
MEEIFHNEKLRHVHRLAATCGLKKLSLSLKTMRLIAFFLNSMLGCFRRSTHRSDSTAAASPLKQPAECEDLAAISVVAYASDHPSPFGSPPADPESCTICLTEFARGDVVRVLPNCKHTFHKDCIDQWLPSRSSRCPNCRKRTIKKEEPARGACSAAGGGNESPYVLILQFGFGAHLPGYL